MWLVFNQPGCPIRKSWNQRLFAPTPGLSQLITSFFASESQGIHRLPFSYFFIAKIQQLNFIILYELVNIVGLFYLQLTRISGYITYPEFLRSFSIESTSQLHPYLWKLVSLSLQSTESLIFTRLIFVSQLFAKLSYDSLLLYCFVQHVKELFF